MYCRTGILFHSRVYAKDQYVTTFDDVKIVKPRIGPTGEPFVSRAIFCEGSQSSQKQLQRQHKFKTFAKLLSAHNLCKLDFWICGGYGPNDLCEITTSTYLCFHQTFNDTKDVTARYAT